MQKSNPDFPKLTKNDQEVLKIIIQQAKIPDADIAKRLGLSTQAISKIRHKLEEKGIIKGYQPVLNLKKLGITVMAVMVINLTPEVWAEHTDEQISERIRKIPYVMNAYRILEPDASHIVVMGFRDVGQMDRYLARIQTKFANEIKTQRLYTFSTDKIITESQIGLLYEILDKEEYPMVQFFLKKKKKQGLQKK